MTFTYAQHVATTRHKKNLRLTEKSCRKDKNRNCGLLNLAGINIDTMEGSGKDEAIHREQKNFKNKGPML